MLVVTVVLGVQWPARVLAADLEFLFTPFHIRDNVSANSVGRTPGDRSSAQHLQ